MGSNRSETPTAGVGLWRLRMPRGYRRQRFAKGRANWLRRSEQPGEWTVPARLRRPGAGRKPKTEEDPELVQALEQLVDPLTRGDPQSPLRWTCKSTRTLARELTARGTR